MADPLDMTAEDREAYFDQSNPMHSRVMAKVAAGLEQDTPADPIEQAEIEANAAPLSDHQYDFGNITVAGGHDPEVDSMVAGWMGEAGLPTWVANSLYQAGAAITEEPTEESIAMQGQQTEAALKAEWGSSYAERIGDIQNFMLALPDEAVEFLEVTGLGNNAQVIRTLDNYLRMSKAP